MEATRLIKKIITIALGAFVLAPTAVSAKTPSIPFEVSESTTEGNNEDAHTACIEFWAYQPADITIHFRNSRGELIDVGASITDPDNETKALDIVNGTAKETLDVGNYGIEITKVPRWYTIPTNEVRYDITDIGMVLNLTLKKNLDGTTSIVTEAVSETSLTVTDAAGNPINAKAKLTYPDGHEEEVEITSDGLNGELPYGTYTIQIIDAPDGYEVGESTIAQFTVAEGNANEFTFALNEAGKLTNTTDDGQKEKSYLMDREGNLISATIKLTDPDGNESIAQVVNGRLPSDLTPGNYTVEIIEVQDGYELNKNSIKKVKVTDGGIFLTDLILFGNGELHVRSKSSEAMPEITDEDGNLINATIEVIYKDGTVETVRIINGHFDRNLPDGDYTVKVVKAPDGFAIGDRSAFSFTVDGDGICNKDFILKKDGTIVEKTDSPKDDLNTTDDNGPFSKDDKGNVYDRYGNLISRDDTNTSVGSNVATYAIVTMITGLALVVMFIFIKR